MQISFLVSIDAKKRAKFHKIHEAEHILADKKVGDHSQLRMSDSWHSEDVCLENANKITITN